MSVCGGLQMHVCVSVCVSEELCIKAVFEWQPLSGPWSPGSPSPPKRAELVHDLTAVHQSNWSLHFHNNCSVSESCLKLTEESCHQKSSSGAYGKALLIYLLLISSLTIRTFWQPSTFKFGNSRNLVWIFSKGQKWFTALLHRSLQTTSGVLLNLMHLHAQLQFKNSLEKKNIKMRRNTHTHAAPQLPLYYLAFPSREAQQ